MMESVILEKFDVAIDPAEVRRFLGSKGKGRPAPAERYDGILSEGVETAKRLIAPKGISAYAAEPERLRSENSCENCGRKDCRYRLD